MQKIENSISNKSIKRVLDFLRTITKDSTNLNSSEKKHKFNEKYVRFVQTCLRSNSNSYDKSIVEYAIKFLIEVNTPFINTITNNFYKTHFNIDKDEMFNEAVSSFISSIEKVDLSKSQLTTYAATAIKNNLSNMSRLYRTKVLSNKDISTYYKVKQYKDSFYKQNQRYPTYDEIIKNVKIKNTILSVKLLKEFDTKYKSLDDIAFDQSSKDNYCTISDIVEDQECDTNDEIMLALDEKNKCLNILNKLSKRESIILRLNTGFDDGIKREPKEIAKELNLTAGRIRQLLAIANNKFKTIYNRPNDK